MASRFRVLGQLDGAGGFRPGTVRIDRAAGVFEVRPLRRRRVYALPLGDVATMVCRRIIVAEVAAKRAARRKRRR